MLGNSQQLGRLYWGIDGLSSVGQLCIVVVNGAMLTTANTSVRRVEKGQT